MGYKYKKWDLIENNKGIHVFNHSDIYESVVGISTIRCIILQAGLFYIKILIIYNIIL